MRIVFLFVLSLSYVLTLRAQPDEMQRTEFFIGYSYADSSVHYGVGQIGRSVYQTRIGSHGINGSAVVNLGRYFGIKGDVSGTFKRERLAFTVPTGIQSSPTTIVTIDTTNSLYNFLGGVQIKDNSRSGRVRPFAHALAGVASRSNRISGGGVVCIAVIPCPASTKETAFAAAFGGGLDVRLRNRLSLRVLQVDYNPIKFDAGTDHNLRLGVGLVF